jgi:hypothetical protein
VFGDIIATTVIGALLLLGAYAFVLLIGSLGSARMRREVETYGDYPAIPEGLRPVRKIGGERSGKGGRARARTVGHVWGHDGNSR